MEEESGCSLCGKATDTEFEEDEEGAEEGEDVGGVGDVGEEEA